jgi:hypothetical protein
MLEKLRQLWRSTWQRCYSCLRFHKKALIIVAISLALAIMSLCFLFTGPGNPLLPTAWRARLAAARLAESVASNEICHEDCLRERLMWRQAIIAYGSNSLFVSLDRAVSDSKENLAWRIEAMNILAKAPEEKLPDKLLWPESISVGAPPELVAAAWKIFPESSEIFLSSIKSLVDNSGDNQERLAVLRLLLREPDSLPADWYLKIASSENESRLRLTALQALSNFKHKELLFSSLTLDAMDKLWRDTSLPRHARRLLAMLATDYGGIDQSSAKKQLEGWLGSALSDEVTDVFIAENLRRYFGADVPIPTPSAAKWEAYDQADPFLNL